MGSTKVGPVADLFMLQFQKSFGAQNIQKFTFVKLGFGLGLSRGMMAFNGTLFLNTKCAQWVHLNISLAGWLAGRL